MQMLLESIFASVYIQGTATLKLPMLPGGCISPQDQYKLTRVPLSHYQHKFSYGLGCDPIRPPHVGVFLDNLQIKPPKECGQNNIKFSSGKTRDLVGQCTIYSQTGGNKTYLEPKHIRLPFEKEHKFLSISRRGVPSFSSHLSGINWFGLSQISGWKFCMFADMEMID